MLITTAHIATKIIKNYFPHCNPKIGIVLGSGLETFINGIKDVIYMDYNDIPGFPKCTVDGHRGNLVLGKLSGVEIICLNGRIHSYEGNNYDIVKTYVRTLKLLGCKYFFSTNASGSLKKNISPGELILITDHINFQLHNPLIGKNDIEFGPRFLSLDNVYNYKLRKKLLKIAKNKNISLRQGVYISVFGPNYETAAEIKAFRMLGADVIGMSTVPEVLIARHCGMKVAVFSSVTNYATGICPIQKHNHKNIVLSSSKTGKIINVLIKNFLLKYKNNIK